MTIDLVRDRRWQLGLLIVTLWIALALRVGALDGVPPGAHYDEAANAILAGEIAFDGYRPIFITSYTGKEVLFFYLAAGLMRLIGPSLFALRLTAALVGVLTVAVAYALGRELARHLLPYRLPGSEPADVSTAIRAAGTVTAALLAVNFAHLLFSRLGFRVITQPLLQGLTLVALLVALRRADYLKARARAAAFALAGVCLGLTAYTYLAARLFPLVIALFWLPLLRRHWRDLALTTGVAAVVLAPLALFFVRNPETFWVRIGQVAGAGPTAADYGNSFITTLAMLFWQGDPYMRFNIPGLPLFDLLTGGLIVLGLVAIAVEWDLGLSGRARALPVAAIILVVAATPIMLLPSALAVEEIVPSNLRALGVLPLVAVPAVYGLYWLWFGKLRLPFGTFAQIAAAALLLAGALVTGNNYFNRWATRADLFYENDADLVAVADLLATRPDDEALYVSALHYRHPTLALTSERYRDVKWLPESAALVIPTGPALLVYPHSSPPPAWVAAWLADAERLPAPNGPDGAPLYSAYRLNGQTAPPPAVALNADFDGKLRLEGYTLVAADGAQPIVRLYWRVTGLSDRPYIPFVHAVDEAGLRWAQREANAYPGEQWAIGEQIIQDVMLALPGGMPGGPYTLVIGLFDGNDRLPLRDAAGRFAGSALRIADIPLAGNPEPPSAPPATVVDLRVNDALTLVGYTRSTEAIEAGVPLPLMLRWRATAPLPELAVRLTAADDDAPPTADSIRPWLTTQPGRGNYPFDIWTTPRIVSDHLDPLVPADWPAGRYRITLAVIAPAAPDAPLLTLDLGDLELLASERVFDLPPFATTADATFGDGLIALAGYTLESAGPETLRLTLVWQALAAPDRAYTVFVHLLNPDGSCCVWQVDAQPRQNGYPTNRWLKSEVVTDEYVIPRPTTVGEYPLEIGLYTAEDAARLPVTTVTMTAGTDYLFLTPVRVDE